jgi:uncharacterized protein (TIGR02452 family)
MPTRTRAAQIAQETVAALKAGRYTNPAGTTVHLRHLLDAAVAGTVSYPPDAPLPNVVPTGNPTAYEVRNESTLDAARRLAAEGFRPVALNFASARHPGGGFLGGARAQEESLCRASGLYACIADDEMYRFHAGMPGGMYTNYAIYSPGVPVFRTEEGELLDEPYPCGFVTSPAVNAGAIGHDERKRVRPEMRDRAEKVLALMAGHGHDAAVLGAWGCGVFKNDPDLIADLFREALVTRFAGVFEKVVFAVMTRDPDMIRPFEERFGHS